MTRFTKMGGKQQYLPATKFKVRPLVPRKKSRKDDSIATSANAVAVIPRVQISDVFSPSKALDSTTISHKSNYLNMRAKDFDSFTDSPKIETSSGEKIDKKRKIRHKSKMTDAEKDRVATNLKSNLGQNVGSRPHFKEAAVRSEARRLQRQREKLSNMICFHCREYGHAVADCPQAKEGDVEGQATGICYKCGSTAHRIQMCRKRVKGDNPYPFALCFVCNEQGHLSSQCPKNDKGLYPNGGSCKYCGSVRHLARDCKPMTQDEGTIHLGTIDVSQGGDDDDITIALHRQATVQKTGKKRNRNERTDVVLIEKPKAMLSKPKAKVVSF
ncbi:hypothetical protein HK096_004222 [Nowakowskiella sp. JEL0078]|nr:hypothetical protein HK096_004222 [Nowakowskiella sp. JEL0078]